jgi:hypothetical protein
MLLLLFGTCCLLGCFEGVDLGVVGLELNFHVGCEVANAGGPFLRRSRVCVADFADGAIDNPLATFAVFHDLLARTLGKDATLFTSKSTLGTRKNGLTLHVEASSKTFVIVDRGYSINFERIMSMQKTASFFLKLDSIKRMH